MAQPVREWLLGFSSVTAVAEEVDAGFGIADLVAGEGSISHLTDRQSKVSALRDPMQVALLEFCSMPKTEEELRSWAPREWRLILIRCVEPLLLRQLLDFQDGVYTAAYVPFDPFTALIAVELKLRDWRRGLGQAGGYRLFANAAYLALPAKRITAAIVDASVHNRIGLLSVARGHVTVAEPAPRLSALQPLRRRLATEQVLAAIEKPGNRRAGAPLFPTVGSLADC